MASRRVRRQRHHAAARRIDGVRLLAIDQCITEPTMSAMAAIASDAGQPAPRRSRRASEIQLPHDF